MSQDDAPNFRRLKTGKVCSNCEWGFYSDSRDWFCGKYDFDFDLRLDEDIDYITCDDFKMFGEIRRSSLLAEDAALKEEGE